MPRDTLRSGTLIGVNKNGVITRYDLQERLRYSDLYQFGVQTFVVNQNVHMTKSRLSGLLVCTYNSIGYIVKAEGCKAIYQPLLPTRGELRILSLYDRNLLPLQQVGGRSISDPRLICGSFMLPHAFVTKKSTGPDGVRVPHSDDRKELLDTLKKYTFDKKGDNMKTEGKTRCPSVVPVVYIQCTDEQRRDLGKCGEYKFTVAIGPMKDMDQQ